MLRTFPNHRIGPSPFSILMTILSDHSFYEKWAVQASFGLAYARACSKHFTFACNIRIGPSSIPILVTKLSEDSFYEKQKVAPEGNRKQDTQKIHMNVTPALTKEGGHQTNHDIHPYMRKD